jgi:hypothetical protein
MERPILKIFGCSLEFPSVVIPNARVFTGGRRACPEQESAANASNGDLILNGPRG